MSRRGKSQLFVSGRRLYRAVNRECHAVLTDLATLGVFEKLARQRLIVATRFVEGDESTRISTERGLSGAPFLLEHEVIEPISYPYEWSASMLADAAKLTIDVQLILLEEAFTLTEASAFNIQFRDGRPVLTDVAAIARPQRLGAWMAHEEFDRQFLFPLLLAQHRGWDLSSYFLAHPNGMNAPRVAEALGAFTGWRPAVLRNVFVPALLGGRPKGLRDRDEAREEDPKFQASVLKRLRDEISALIGAPKVDAGRQVPATRTDALASILRELGVATVLDVNTGSGAFALAAASAGARVCAIDADSRAIDSLYLKTQESQARITPLVVDIAFPSPATGFLNRDRASFLDRPFADAALLMDRWRELITAIGLPVQEIVTLLSRLTREWLIIKSGPLSNNGALHFREFLGALDSVFAVGKDVSVSDPATHIIALRKRS